MKYYITDGTNGLWMANLQMVDNPAQVLASLMKNGLLYCGQLFDGVYAGFVNNNGSTTGCFVKEVSYLRLNTQFALHECPEGTGELMHFVDYRGGVKAGVDWVVPDGYRLFFCYQQDGGRFPYHLLLVNPDKEFVMIPMSNCHDGGSVCHGDIEIDRSIPIAEAFNHALTMYTNSYWNDHLITEEKFVRHNRYIFRWDKNMKQLPMLDPEDHLRVIHGATFVGSSMIANVIEAQDKPVYVEREDEPFTMIEEVPDAVTDTE